MKKNRSSLQHWLSAALCLALAGCAEEAGREVSMAELGMKEDSLYYLDGEHQPFSGVATGEKGGERISRSVMVDGHREGAHEIWWQGSEQLRSLCNYREGFRHGTLTTWDEDGAKLSEVTYVDGALEGPSRKWYPSGALETEGSYLRGKQDGLWTFYYEHPDNDRKREQASYEEGRLNGEKRTWSSAGRPTMLGNFVQGQMEGAQETWFDNGSRASAGNYEKGRRVGVHEVWHENGVMASRTTYDQNGAVLDETLWTLGGAETDGIRFEEPPPIELPRGADYQPAPN